MTHYVNTMPSDKTSEMFVLGAMLNSVDAVNDCIPKLDVQDFYFSENQAIFQAIFSLYSQGFSCNPINIAQELKENKNVSLDYLISLDLGGSYVDIDYYLKTVLNNSKLRRVLMLANASVLDAKKERADSGEIIGKLQTELFSIQDVGYKETRSNKEILENFEKGRNFSDHTLWMFDQVREGKMPYSGIPSGFDKLDRCIGFFRPGCYYTIGARTSMGKTTFILNMIRNMNFLGKRTSVGFFSLEMTAPIMLTKFICLLAGVKYDEYDAAQCTKSELESILTWGEKVKDIPLYIEDQGGITMSQLRARSKRMVQNHKIEILFIDYLTCLKPDSSHSNNHMAVNEISKGIQQLAKELNIPIVVLAQLNRQVASRASTIPTLADFRESGSIEEDSDACLMLHRPSYYNPADKPGVSQLYVAKNRLRGQIKRIDFHMPYGEVYEELEPVDESITKINQSNHATYFDRE